MGRIIWKSFKVGGNPDREAYLGTELYNELMLLQDVGWQIVSVDRNPISRVWSSEQNAYVDTIQYLIIAKAEEEEEEEEEEEDNLKLWAYSKPNQMEDHEYTDDVAITYAKNFNEARDKFLKLYCGVFAEDIREINFDEYEYGVAILTDY